MTTVDSGLFSTRAHPAGSSFGPFFLTKMAAEGLSDRRLSGVNDNLLASTTLIIRRLPRNTTNEAIRTMLLFAKDLQETELVPNEYQEDHGFVTAAAHFATTTGASEAQTMLNGKPNTAGQANMIVEIVSKSVIGSGRRNTLDPSPARGTPQVKSPPPTQILKSSRFNDTFQSIEKMSPPPVGSPPDQMKVESKPPLHNMFSPQSPNNAKDRSRVSGKSVIGEDGADDETGELLKDPLAAYMKNDNPSFLPGPRQHSNPRFLASTLNALSLNTNMNPPSPSGFVSPRSAIHTHASNGGFPSSAHVYQGGNQYLRHNYPPVNPADQNPPCNTLYVGNLPMDTSEDELKAMFSKQRGYKRLCFRTKQNGPMCFVEFEDVSFATKALNELYGVQLHNSVKGGIRLSFSKNPLGVRSGQPGSTNPSTPLSPGASMMSSMSPLSPGGFSTANGPPPGLSVPPGLNMSSPTGSPLQNGQFVHQGFPIGMSPVPGHRGMPMGNGTNGSHLSNMYPDYMMGR